MQDIYDGLLLLNDLYYDASFDEYQQARQDLEEQVKRDLPGFTVAHAVEIGTAGAGDAAYHHGGVAHVLCPVLKRYAL